MDAPTTRRTSPVHGARRVHDRVPLDRRRRQRRGDKTVAFTIGDAAGDNTLAPVTTATLDPAQPGPGQTYSAPVTVQPVGARSHPAGPPPTNVDVDATGTQWTPATVSLTAGDSITWRFGATRASPHDAWLVPPGGNPSPSAARPHPGHERSCSRAVLRCRARSPRPARGRSCAACTPAFTDGAWNGMTGTAAVTRRRRQRPSASTTRSTGSTAATGSATPTPAAPARSRRRFTVSAEGQHTVEYRSADKAGNVEATKSVAFGIDLPDARLPGHPGVRRPVARARRRCSCATPRPASTPTAARSPTAGSSRTASMFGRTVTRTYTQTGTYTAKLTATDDEGRQSTKEVPVVVTAPDVVPPTVVGELPTSPRGPAPLRVQFTAAGGPGRAEATCSTRGTSATAARRWRRTRATRTCQTGTYTAKVTVQRRQGGATATDTVEIVVTNPPGNARRASRLPPCRRRGAAPLDVLLTRRGNRSRRRRAHLHVGLRRRLGGRLRRVGHAPLRAARDLHGDRDGVGRARRDATRRRSRSWSAIRPATRPRP